MKSILSIFCLAFVTLGCQTLTSKTTNNDQVGCTATTPKIPSLKQRYMASGNRMDEVESWLNSVSTLDIASGGIEYIVELKKTLNNRLLTLNLQNSEDMTLIAGIPDPDRRASQDKTHVIDIVFLYPSDEERPRELFIGVTRSVSDANEAFEGSGVNARLRVVGVESSSELNSIDRTSYMALKTFLRNQLPELRRVYGADLAYIVLPKLEGACGHAVIRGRGLPKSLAQSWASIGIISVKQVCVKRLTLAHEVGHNLGLVHDEGSLSRLFSGVSSIQGEEGKHRDTQDSVLSSIPFVRGGKGYASPTKCQSDKERFLYGTVMTASIPCTDVIPRFSANATYKGQVIGSATVNASEALLYTIEEASNYATSVFPDDYEWQMEE